MSKFKVRMKLTGFELELEGERETISEVGKALRTQMSNALLPAIATADNGNAAHSGSEPKTIEGKVNSRRSSKRRSSSGQAEAESHSIIELQHDPTTYCNPVQTWRPVQKAMWLIYVVSRQSGIDKMTPTEVAETYNTHFGKTGTLRPSNVSRDLSKEKAGNPPLVSQDPKTQKFGLFDAGEKEVEKLIEAVKNGA